MPDEIKRVGKFSLGPTTTATPPDPMADPAPTNPLTGRMDLPVKCALDNLVWNPPDHQPCFHDEQELEAFFATQPPGPNQRQRWIPTGTPPEWQTPAVMGSGSVKRLSPLGKPEPFTPAQPPVEETATGPALATEKKT